MTQPWNPEVQGKAGISPEEYNNWVNKLNSQTSMGGPGFGSAPGTAWRDSRLGWPEGGTTIKDPRTPYPDEDRTATTMMGRNPDGTPITFPGIDFAKVWKDALLFGSTGAQGGNTVAQDIDAGNIGAGSSPEAYRLLNRVGNQLKELWNRPIMAPTITKPEHDLLIRGEGGGAHNWQN